MVQTSKVATTPTEVLPSRCEIEAAEAAPGAADAHQQPTVKAEKCPAIFALRETEFSRLDKEGQVYLDYTGGMVYPESLVRAHTEQMLQHTFGNPHSNNPTSLASTALCERARSDVLAFFNADPDEYMCIFTQNASGALRIVGESFPFTKGSSYTLLTDNHNSVNGIREFAKSSGAEVTYAKTSCQLRIDETLLAATLSAKKPSTLASHPSLFAYPAQSNFSGVKHSLDWVEKAQQLGWYVLLDAAAFVPTNRLDLSSSCKPDFVSLSFYKIFGYPTGIGALLMRKRVLPIMRKPWFAGGTIKFVSTSNTEGHLLAADHEAFEDGTVNYLGLPAVSNGLKFMENLGMEAVCSHIAALTHDLIDGLKGLKHSSGVPLLRFLGPDNVDRRGGTIALDLFDKDGHLVDPRLVEQLANDAKISIRSGCFCNPGDSEMVFPDAWNQIRRVLVDTGDPLMARERGLHVAGALRFSVGIATSEGDIEKLLTFLLRFKDCTMTDDSEGSTSMASSHGEVFHLQATPHQSVVGTPKHVVAGSRRGSTVTAVSPFGNGKTQRDACCTMM